MIELVPWNNKRIEVTIREPDDNGQLTAAVGLSLTLRVVAKPDAKAPLGTMVYPMQPYAQRRNTYYADVPGQDIAQQLSSWSGPLALQIMDGGNVQGFVDAVIAPTRRL